MKIQARQAHKHEQTRYYLYCSEECAAAESDREIILHPAFAVDGMILVPAYENRHCHVCRKKLEGPRLTTATTSKIPVSGY